MKTAKKAAKPTKATKRTTKVAKPRVNKSAFIRSQPETLSAAEVVKAGKREKMKFSENYVISIRSRARVQAAAAKATKKLERATKKAANVKAAARVVDAIVAQPRKASAKAPKKSMNGLAHTVQA